MTTAENNEVLSPDAQVTITGRNVEVPEHFQERVNKKLARIEKLDPTLTFFHVELQHEPNPRREAQSDRIQITATGKGHIARAEAKEDSFYAALETALAKMERSLRKVKVRRNTAKSGHRAPKSTGQVAAELVAEAQQAKAKKPGQYEVDPYEAPSMMSNRATSFAPRSTRPRRSAWTRHSAKWSWWDMTSTSS